MNSEEHRQAWITSALSDEEVIQAMVLAMSLKQVGTKRKIWILISEDVTLNMKYLLLQVFHGVVSISEKEVSDIGLSNVGLDLIVKLWCLKLTQHEKCVYLSPFHLAKKFCDELFNYSDESGTLINQFNLGKVFVVNPSITEFKKWIGNIQLLANRPNTNDPWSNSIIDCAGMDSEKYAGFLASSMLHFRTQPWIVNEIGQENSTQWINVYLNQVLPFIEAHANDEILEKVRRTINPRAVQPQLFNLQENRQPKPKFEFEGAIAIVGMSCRLPGANNADEYWKLLSEGKDPIRKFPTERAYNGPSKAREMKAGFLNCPIDEFDAKFFGISPREATLMDPQQRLLLEVTWECLEHAGINPQTLNKSDTGVFVGMWQQNYEQIVAEASDELEEKNLNFLHVFLGNKLSATASRISFCLGFHGPAVAVESGCSSALAAMHLACESLHRGETSLALASGVNLVLLPIDPFTGTAGCTGNSPVLSKDFKCKTFDESADGFVRAEACGVVALKRFEDARRDGDNILAVVRGSALNNDGTGVSFGTPNSKAQEDVYRAALKRANVLPADISFIETHGTGTAVGDPTEMYAVGNVYSEGRTEPLLLGAVKTNIGHTESAAGIASLLKVILCMEHAAVPPNRHLKKLNPKIDLARIPACIPVELTPWIAKPKIAAISAFSMSATNVHVIIQEAPTLEKTEDTTPNTELITFSAKSEEALIALTGSYIEFLQQNPDLPLKDIAYGLNVGRAHLSHRIAIVASDTSRFLYGLETQRFTQGKASVVANKIAFLFTGQGSQYFGMAKGLFEAFPIFKKEIMKCDHLFRNKLGVSLIKVLFEDDRLLKKTIFCQPAIFCVEYCLVQLWKAYGILPDCVLGHSVGEFAAAFCAGILTLEDAMKLVVGRSCLINDLPAGCMLAIKANEKRIVELAKLFTENYSGLGGDAWIDIAVVNSDEEVVVSVSLAHIKLLEDFCTNSGIQCIKLNATHAFHSRAMDPVLHDFGIISKSILVGNLNCKYISGTFAKPMEAMEFGSHYWQSHLRHTVRFSDAVQILRSECKTLIEIGPHPVLLGLSMTNVEDLSNFTLCPSLRKKEEAVSTFLTSVGKLYVSGVDLDWIPSYGIRQKFIQLPTYPFQRQKYWVADVTKKEIVADVLHPFLGTEFLSPVSETIFCQTLRVKELSYLEDHKVADCMVIPGAALLECFLAAGRAILQGGSKNKFTIAIEKFEIHAALGIEHSCPIQTLVATEYENSNSNELKYRLKLNQKLEGHVDKWKHHATAYLKPSSKVTTETSLDLNAVMSRLTHKASVQDCYKTMATLGIHLGPRFQGIVSAWYGPNELLTEIKVPEGSEEYICHPIVLDTMIQTYAFRDYLSNNEESRNILQLPICVSKFTWLSKVLSDVVYAHCNTSTATIKLYDSAGEVLAVMEGLELIQTTVHSVLRGIREESVGVPNFMTEKWRSILGKTDSRVDLSQIQATSKASPRINAAEQTCDNLVTYERIKDLANWLNEIIFQSFCESIQKCNWPWPKVNVILYIEQWIAMLPKTINHGILGIYICELEKRGFLARVDNESFKILRALPTAIETQTIVSDNILNLRSITTTFLEEEISFVQKYRKCLPLILQNKMTPLHYLFPEDGSTGGALEFYRTGFYFKYQNALILAYLAETLSEYVNTASTDGVLRILEIGAGSGTTTAQCLEMLKAFNISFNYTFTDISKQFLNVAKKKFGNGEEMNYGIFNIENDPLAQGFAPQEFDIIIGVQVIHATANILESLVNLKKVLRMGGVLLLGEALELHASQTFSFGMLDGWWRFTDFRQYSYMTALLHEQQWTNCLEIVGFGDISILATDTLAGVVCARNTSKLLNNVAGKILGNKWHLIEDGSDLCGKLSQGIQNHDREVILDAGISKNSAFETCKTFTSNSEGIICFFTQFLSNDIQQTQTQIIATLLSILQTYEKSAEQFTPPKLVVVTRGVYCIGDSVPGNPNGSTTWGMLKVFRNENPSIKICLIDLDSVPTPFEASQILGQLWNQDDELYMAFRQDKTYALRLSNLQLSLKFDESIQLPNSDCYKFINPQTSAFEDIQFEPVAREEPKEGQVELEVRACALNFRDLFMVMRPEGFNLPNDENIESVKSVGYDVSGIVVAVGSGVRQLKIGDEVFGYAENGALGTHALALEKKLLKMPKYMTHENAATFTCAFLTATVSLIEVAKITSSDRVLIHAASGGVGLAAIQVVKSIGADIYATAGSQRKQAYLRNLGIKYVYSSRNTSFGEAIKQDTRGSGVTVVLNSLTGPNFKETSLGLCGTGARFVEIGKVNIWKPHEVELLRPDVKYTIVDMSLKDELIENLSGIKFDTAQQMLKIEKCVLDGIYSGLPCVTFPLAKVREAFHYFQKAKHIGKVVVKIPQPIVTDSGKIKHKRQIFNDKSTYMITGGLGGIGIEVTKWMLSAGARHIVLVGRRLPSDTAQNLIEAWNKSGSNVLTVQMDIGYYENCKHIIDWIKNSELPPLRGIMHAAGVLSDAVVNKQTVESFDYVFRPKVYGGWYLHELTLNYQMEFFIMFSSISGIMGMMGQSNHAAANRFLDSLSHYRVNMGLPATTINWGGWSDIGAAAGIGMTTEVFNGIRIFTPAQGIAALEKIMTLTETQIAVSDVPDWNFIKSILAQGRYTDEMKSNNQPVEKLEQNYSLLQDITEAILSEERHTKIQNYVEVVLKDILSLPKAEIIDIDQNFTDLGIDSLMSMEMKNRFQVILGNKRTLTLSALQDYRTVRSLSKHISNLFETETVENLKSLAEIIAEDIILPTDICASHIPAPLPSRCQQILLTGSTGHLGVHCLDQILKSRRGVTVYCLIRGNSEFQAMLKLHKSYLRSGLSLSTLENGNIRILPGDVSAENLGLSEEMFSILSQEIDGIMHCAAKVDHIGQYTDGTANDIRSHNVTGLLNILRFASSHKTKFLQFASSMICSEVDGSGQYVEDYPKPKEIQTEIKWGYLLSKIISEKLVADAAERGIPITTIRYPFILGNSETGQMPTSFNHYWDMLVASIQVRLFPKDPVFEFPIIAVDSSAKVAVHLFFNDEAEQGVYNLIRGSSLSEEVIIEILKQDYGLVCTAVPLKEWRDVVFEDQSVASLVAPIRGFYHDDNLDSSLQFVLQGLEKLKESGFSPKMIKNFPEISKHVESAEFLIRKHLCTYFQKS